MAEQQQQVTVGYWGFRGRAQPLRTLLAYSGVEWTDKQYTDRNEWFETDKPALNTNFANLPYLKVGDFHLGETIAIATYIVYNFKQTALMGTDLLDKMRCLEVWGLCEDLNQALYKILFNKEGWEERGTAYEATLKDKCAKLEKQVGENNFCNGTTERWTDFFAYEWLLRVSLLFPEQWKQFPNLERFLRAFEELPKVKEYFASGKVPKYHMPPAYTPWQTQWKE